MIELNEKFDLAVIGAGPAGIMAAGIAGENGAKVVLLEQNQVLGKKLLITGKGRCNITNAAENNRAFIKELGPGGEFLFSTLNNFGPNETISFFNKLGIETKIERGRRVFPSSDKSIDILNALIAFLNQNNVKILKNEKVMRFSEKNHSIEKIILSDRDIIAKNFVIATGGLSYPKTGSTGDGYGWAKKLGHNIIKLEPALTPILVKEKWINELEGLSLKNVSIGIYQNNKKQDEQFGEALFTDKGMSGPIILDLSRKIGQLLKTGSVELKINFKPALDYQTLDKRIQRDFLINPNKMFKNGLDALLPKKIIPTIVRLSKIYENKKIGQITKKERGTINKLLREFKLNVKCLDGFNKAIITVGGVDLKQVDPKTMKSKIIDNLYFAGEILNVHGPTGGYNLQICFSTGYTAGKNALI